MKRTFFLFLLITICFQTLTAQPTRDSADTDLFYEPGGKLSAEKLNNLYLLGKVWGFLKYFHPNITSGKFDWDKELINFLPGYLSIKSTKERNDSLSAWIQRLGEVPAGNAGDYTQINNAKLMIDFSWMRNKKFSPGLIASLNFIKNNRKKGDQHYIKFYSGEDIHFISFQNENSYYKSTYPAAHLRLLAVYRFWNAIEYWYPYKYNFPVAWDEVLKEHIVNILKAKNAEEYVLDIQKLLSSIKDGHGTMGSVVFEKMKGNYYMPFMIKYVQHKFIIAAILNDSLAKTAGIKVGDIVVKIDSEDISKRANRQLPFICAATKAFGLLRFSTSLRRTNKEFTALEILRNGRSENIMVHNFFSKKLLFTEEATFTYQKDSSFCMLKNGIAYLNLGKLLHKDSLALTKLISSSNGLIIDCRQNAIEDPKRENANMLISDLICPSQVFNRFSSPQPDYPGVFLLTDSSRSVTTSGMASYHKPIIIIINEGVISVGEMMSMIFKKAPNAVLLGSNTSGTNGGSTIISLPGNVVTQFTCYGVYWPDGQETQKIGIIPDIKIYPTIEGYRQNKDELLDAAVSFLSKQK